MENVKDNGNVKFFVGVLGAAAVGVVLGTMIDSQKGMEWAKRLLKYAADTVMKEQGIDKLLESFENTANAA
jgi:hypothetical protein